MELARGIIIPVLADYVLTPEVYYADRLTGICFQTPDDQFGRITFENLDALKVCRGEYLPYEDDWREGQPVPWVYKVESSRWQQERYHYEKENYGSAYEFGGNVEEMLTDFSHYIFSFHDQFVEAIARGFWFEQDRSSLFKRALLEGHPFLPLPATGAEKITAHTLTCQVRRTQKTEEELIYGAGFCSQKIMEFALELEGDASVGNSLVLSCRNGKLISSLRGYFGHTIAEFEGIACLENVKPHVEKYMREVYERRKAMGK